MTGSGSERAALHGEDDAICVDFDKRVSAGVINRAGAGDCAIRICVGLAVQNCKAAIITSILDNETSARGDSVAVQVEFDKSRAADGSSGEIRIFNQRDSAAAGRSLP